MSGLPVRAEQRCDADGKRAEGHNRRRGGLAQGRASVRIMRHGPGLDRCRNGRSRAGIGVDVQVLILSHRAAHVRFSQSCGLDCIAMLQ